MTIDILQPATPNADDGELTTLKNDISARLYGEYYYELPNGGTGHRVERDIIDAIIPLVQSYTERAVLRGQIKVLNKFMGHEIGVAGYSYDEAGSPIIFQYAIKEEIDRLTAEQSGKEASNG